MNKLYIKGAIAALLLGISFSTYSQIINTTAGNGVQGYSGNGGAATAAEINQAWDVCFDAAGNFCISDFGNNVVRSINTSGIINTIAGNGSAGFFGDSGPATAAELTQAASVAFDGAGNYYIADWGNNRIRKVNSSGTISTFAGTGTGNFSGDGGPATAADINNPVGLVFDISGNLYIDDQNNQRIRIINTSGIINTFAGNGVGSFSGDGGPATAAELNEPIAIAIDLSGNIFIADFGNNRIRLVNTSGTVSTLAGNGGAGFMGDGGPATAAELYLPQGVAVSAIGEVFISDNDNNRIRIINTSGVINTIAGNGTASYFGDGGPATAAEIYSPSGITTDNSGNVYFVDRSNNRVREITGILTGTKTISSVPDEVGVYPSPTTGNFTVTGILQEQTVEIYNYTGQKLSSTLSDKNSMQFDISNNTDGIYLIRILNKNGSPFATKKIVKIE
jgi:hypothetical protein